MNLKVSLVAIGLVTLHACGGPEPAADAEEPIVDEHVFQDQTEALERAREAEAKLKEAAERTREAVEDP